jgi:uncharacterized protein YciI
MKLGRILLSAVLMSALIFAAMSKADESLKLTEGLKTYYLVFLLKGENRSQSAEEADRIQAAHLAHLGKMYAEGKLAIAGPLLDDQELRGICVYDVKTMEEAKKLAEADPAVKAGRLRVEVHPWMSKQGAKLP